MGGGGRGFAPLPFDGDQQGGLLTAYEGAGAQAQFQIKGEVGAQDVLAQQTVIPGLSDSDLQPFDGNGVLRTHINITLGTADGIGGDGHRFNDAEGIAL